MKLKKIKLVYLTFFIITIVIIAIIQKKPLEQDVCLNHQNMRELNEGWRIKDTNELIKIGIEHSYEVTGEFLIYRTLPKSIKDGDNLLLRAMHSHVQIFIDGDMIYEYGKLENRWITTPGSAWLIVPLEEKYEGKIISISFDSNVSKYQGRSDRIYITDRASAILYILENNLVGIVTCFMILTIGLILLVLWIACLKVNNISKLLYLAIFSILLFIWSLSETTVLQFFLGNMHVTGVMNFEIIILLQIPMMLFFSIDENNEVKPELKKYLFIPMINFIICNYLFYVHGVDLSRSVFVTHISLILCTVVVIIDIYRKRKKELKKTFYSLTKWRLDSWGFAFMSVMVIIDIGRYYTSFYSDSAMYSRFGLLFFILALGIQTLHSSVKEMLIGQKNQIYRFMAYHDSLTQTYNRTAFEERIHELEKRPSELNNISVLVMDINNLKHINDTFGHTKGDECIVENANYYKRLFGDIATCYRTGGDEFVIICPSEYAQLFELRIQMMEKEQENEYCKNINFAYGYAKYDPQQDHTIMDIVNRADKRMYENKELNRKL